jgi:hypothetical protein
MIAYDLSIRFMAPDRLIVLSATLSTAFFGQSLSKLH